MKAIILVLSPKECANLLNGDLSILVRKKFPKDYVGWVYIYVTKDNNQLVRCQEKVWGYYKYKKGELESYFNGKVVARFWCDKVEEIKTDYAPRDTFFKECCLTPTELFDYIGHSKWYAIHITKVDPFDKPKEIKEFNRFVTEPRFFIGDKCCNEDEYLLTHVPSTYCYIEVSYETRY